jgi:hypothetical protein
VNEGLKLLHQKIGNPIRVVIAPWEFGVEGSGISTFATSERILCGIVQFTT